jgi:hypothetical protein
MGEVGWFLGVRVLRDRPNKKLWLYQDSYIKHLSQAMAWSLVVGYALNLVLDKVSATSVYSLGIAAS